MKPRADGSYLCTKFFVIWGLPLIPLGTHRVIFGETEISREGLTGARQAVTPYRILEEHPPHIRQVIQCWCGGYLIVPMIFPVMFLCPPFLGPFDHSVFTENAWGTILIYVGVGLGGFGILAQGGVSRWVPVACLLVSLLNWGAATYRLPWLADSPYAVFHSPLTAESVSRLEALLYQRDKTYRARALAALIELGPKAATLAKKMREQARNPHYAPEDRARAVVILRATGAEVYEAVRDLQYVLTKERGDKASGENYQHFLAEVEASLVAYGSAFIRSISDIYFNYPSKERERFRRIICRIGPGAIPAVQRMLRDSFNNEQTREELGALLRDLRSQHDELKRLRTASYRYVWTKEAGRLAGMKRFFLDINGDGNRDLFLGPNALSDEHHGTWLVFLRQATEYYYVGGIGLSPRAFELLPASHHGVRDLKTILPYPQGSGYIWTFQFNGKFYERTSEEKIRDGAPAITWNTPSISVEDSGMTLEWSTNHDFRE